MISPDFLYREELDSLLKLVLAHAKRTDLDGFQKFALDHLAVRLSAMVDKAPSMATKTGEA